jgi:hypothetical protein
MIPLQMKSWGKQTEHDSLLRVLDAIRKVPSSNNFALTDSEAEELAGWLGCAGRGREIAIVAAGERLHAACGHS